MFSYQKFHFGNILEGFEMENVGIINDHFVYFVVIWYILQAIWYILWSFGIFCGHLVYIFPVW
jgi:hypothetical protein